MFDIVVKEGFGFLLILVSPLYMHYLYITIIITGIASEFHMIKITPF